jgi:hypothetical protein
MNSQYMFFYFCPNYTKTKFVFADAEVGHSHPFPRHQFALTVVNLALNLLMMNS